jgi:pimeloyl-ACP methyl ester carboxylesterase
MQTPLPSPPARAMLCGRVVCLGAGGLAAAVALALLVLQAALPLPPAAFDPPLLLRAGAARVLGEVKGPFLPQAWDEVVRELGPDFALVQRAAVESWVAGETAHASWERQRVPVRGGDVFFVVRRPKKAPERPQPPWVLLHGWPSSFLEYVPAAELWEGEEELVVPSMPGIGGLSSEARHAEESADMLLEALARMGYGRVKLYGGDWGGVVAQIMAQKAPARVDHVALQFFPRLPQRPWTVARAVLALSGVGGLEEREELGGGGWAGLGERLLRESDYMHAHVAHPDLTADLLSTSPHTAVHYVLDKFRRWRGPRGEDDGDDGGRSRGATNESSADAPLGVGRAAAAARGPAFADVARASAVLYVASGKLRGSLCFYRETLLSPRWWTEFALRSLAPTTRLTLVDTPDEPFLRVPVAWGRELAHNPAVLRLPSGGHFFPLEQPAAFADLLRRLSGGCPVAQ